MTRIPTVNRKAIKQLEVIIADLKSGALIASVTWDQVIINNDDEERGYTLAVPFQSKTLKISWWPRKKTP